MTDTFDGVVVTPPVEQAPGQQPVATTTGDGFLVGTEPSSAAERQAFAQQQAAANQQGRTFTVEEIEKARAEERDKVMKRQAKLEAEAAELRKSVEELAAQRQAEEDAKAAAEAERLRLLDEAEKEKMTTKEYVKSVEQKFQEQFNEMREREERAQILLEQERQIHALAEYRAQRLADPEIQSNMIPDLAVYVGGNTAEEIDASIALALERSASIVRQVQEEQQTARRVAPGVSPYAPATGPIDESQQPRVLTNEQLAALSPAEYARLRPQLLPQARPQR